MISFGWSGQQNTKSNCMIDNCGPFAGKTLSYQSRQRFMPSCRTLYTFFPQIGQIPKSLITQILVHKIYRLLKIFFTCHIFFQKRDKLLIPNPAGNSHFRLYSPASRHMIKSRLAAPLHLEYQYIGS